MSSLWVAIVFDDTARPETTGVYCRRALQGLGAVEHYRPAELERVPRTGFDLYLHVDDGLPYRLPEDLHPAAFWAIDTHLDFERCLGNAHDFDLVFAAQRDGAEALRDAGIRTTWLPLACDPEVHRKHDVVKRFDFCFVGNLLPGPREDLVRLLQRHFPSNFVGRRYFDEMARTYSASRLVFNRSVRNDVNMRVFEALACGSLCLTNDLGANGQDELFRDGVHLATYADAGDLLDKVHFYLDREAAREQIAAAGRAEALARHTYRQRMEVVLREGLAWPVAVPIHAVVEAPFEDEEPDPRGDASYFEHARPELLALIPGTARKVLDVGCGAGRLGEAVKARQAAEVVGIEQNEAAARAARGRLDRVLVGDVETMAFDFAPGSFDAVVCGDVLEHLRDPGRFLRLARDWLRPDGQLIASIPNVRHHSVVRSLLEGNWTYEPAGLLDRTHLCFFTRRDIDDLFAAAGYAVSQWGVVPGPGDEEWWQTRRDEVHPGRLHVAGLAAGEAEEFCVYQYLVTAQPVDIPAVVWEGETPVEPTHPARPEPCPPGTVCRRSTRKLRIMLLGDFGSSWRHETLTADVLIEQGHEVGRFHEYDMPSVRHVVEEANSGRYDCLLFYKGRIAARTPEEVFAPTGEAIAAVIEQARVPCYTWYVDRAYQFDFQPSREAWMRRVAPLCRVAFVAEAALARTSWARWHVLREPVDDRSVQCLAVPDNQRKALAFIGQLYGSRAGELAPLAAAFPLEFITDTYGAALGPAIQAYRIIVGPRYPTVPGYWGNRVYVVLGHGGFLLAPEVEGMCEEGILPGVHYAALGDDPVADVRHWLARPAERERIARAGQDLVLERFTYRRAVRELCRVIEETL
jgi:2-polyprenyl-3-methyl-5-hydroxy-6-metoxy-1,4-benzoquinol methylase